MGFHRIVAKILEKFVQPIIAAALLCLIAGVAIWLWGAHWSMRGIAPFRDDDIRAVVTLGLLIVGGMLLLVVLVRGIIALIRARRAAQSSPAQELSEEEIETAALDRAFSKAVDVLTTHWTGSGRGIYGLPWYLVVGGSQSGKTTLIDQSDLRFPIDHEIAAELNALPTSQARELLTWRVAGNEAVMLDVDGRYFATAREDDSVRSALWQRLLTNLRLTRGRRPVDGIVLVVDFVEFSSMDHLEREAYSAQLRRNINMLVESLGTQMTVHIVFSKLDLVAGFTDYYNAISGAEREALFGFHFVYEGQLARGWQGQFADQYTSFLDRLDRQLKKRVYELKNATSRQEAFAFYRTFVGLEEPLKAFLQVALSPDRFTTPPLVRGIYFASSRQENVPRNIFLENIGDRYALAPPLYGTSQAASYPYFGLNILKKAVFPEAGLAGNNLRQAVIYRSRAWIAGSVGALVVFGGAVYWYDHYIQNLAQAEEVRNLTNVFMVQDSDESDDFTGVSLLPQLNTIREATFAFGNYREVGPVIGQLSLYQGDRIGPIVDRAYRRLLNAQFGPLLIRGIENELSNACPSDGGEALELLRVYRMLGELEGRDRQVIERYFTDIWQQAFQADVKNQISLANHLSHMLSNEPVAYRINPTVVSSAQAELGAVPPFQRVYSGLRALAKRQLPDGVEFRTSAGTAFDIVYQADALAERDEASDGMAIRNGVDKLPDRCDETSQYMFSTGPFEISRFFTRQEYIDFFLPQHTNISRAAADDLWVLGELENTEFSPAYHDRISQNIRDIYSDDYIRTWRQALNNMEVRPFGDIRDAVNALGALSGPNNPLRRVAELVRDNTVINPKEGVEVQEASSTLTDLKFDDYRETSLRINAAFVDIRRMLEDSLDGGVTNIDEIQEALIALHSLMREIADAQRPNATALEVAIQRADLKGDDPIYHLQRIAQHAPAPFNRHLEDVANESWRIIMSGATEELNRLWNKEIYGDYVRLIEGRYPFDRASPTDVPLVDFVTFFEPGGIFDSFYHEQLLTFVDETTGMPRMIDGQSLDVDRDVFRQLRSATEITRTLFDANGEVYVEFSVAPVKLSSNLRRAVLNFEGQIVSSTHGASQPITIVWPNILNGPVSSRLDLAPLASAGSSAGVQYDGPWSWLRVYDTAERSNVTNNSVDVTFSNANGQSGTFRLRTESRVNLFFNSPLSDFDLPPYLRRPTE